MTSTKKVEEEESLDDYEKFYLISENYSHKFIIGKTKTSIIIKYKNYEVKLNNDILSTLTKSVIDTIDESYDFIINIFEEHKAFIKNIEVNKSITLIFKVYVLNKEKDIEIKLLYEQNKKDSILKN